MAASYPEAVRTFTGKQDGVDNILAEHINSLQDEVTAIEAELGINPRRSAVSVDKRIELHSHDGVDGSTLLDPTTAIMNSRLRANVLPNSSWYLGTLGWTGADQNGFEAEVRNDHAGTSRLSTTGNPTGADVEAYSQEIPLTGGITTVVFSGQIQNNVTSGGLEAYFTFYDSGNNAISSIVLTPPQMTTGYYSLSDKLLIPANTAYGKARCIVKANTVAGEGSPPAFRRLKLEADTGSGKPSPYSNEADVILLGEQLTDRVIHGGTF